MINVYSVVLDRLFITCQLDKVDWFVQFSSSISLLIFCLLGLSATDRMGVEVSNYYSRFVYLPLEFWQCLPPVFCCFTVRYIHIKYFHVFLRSRLICYYVCTHYARELSYFLCMLSMNLIELLQLSFNWCYLLPSL